MKWNLLKKTASSWSEDNASTLAAALAYYAIFSLAPLLVICIAITGMVLGSAAAQEQILQHIGEWIDPESARQIQGMIQEVNDYSDNRMIAMIGMIVLLFGASGVFGQLQLGLNLIWGVTPRPDRSWIIIIKDRFFSFFMVVSVAVLLLLFLLLNILLTAVSELLKQYMFYGHSLGIVLNAIFSLSVLTVLFSMIFKVIPDVKLKWRDVFLGAILTALLFTVGNLLLGIYLGNSQVATVYGAAGSLIVILIWIYYSTQLLFFGAEFTKVYMTRDGKAVLPSKNAMLIANRYDKILPAPGIKYKEE